MSRVAKWKLDKAKVKVVFRLQFNATHIPQSGWDKLFISFIPADSGKATAKTTKANVRNGTCKWADPIYETTRLLQDTKTKLYDEKLYKLVVAMGSTRSSVLGETTINLADYADASKPSSIALPLHGCDSGTTLHVTVQLLTSKTGFREFEQQREIRERGLQTASDQTSPDGSSDGIGSHMDKVNAKVRFKEKSKEIPSLEEEAGLNEEYADSAGGFDGSSNTSGSLYAEKHETSSAHEIESLKSTVSGDVPGINQSPEQEKGDSSDHRFMTHGTTDWGPAGWCADDDLATAYEENSRLRGCLDVAQSSVYELKHEVSSLQNSASQIGEEAQKLEEKLAAEIESGAQLANEVSLLKSECSQLKDDLVRLTMIRSCSMFTSGEAVEKQEGNSFQDLQLSWLKGILIVEDKVHQLQQKACLGFHNGDFRSLKADFEALIGFLEDLKRGTQKEVLGSIKDTREIGFNKDEEFVSAACGTELYQPDLGMLHISIPTLASHDSNSVNSSKALEGKIFELLRELDESKAERETLAKKMDQMECYYEALIQELEESQRQMLGELQNLRNEHSTCLYTISSAKTEIDTLHQNLNEQILRFSEEKRELDTLNQELERRAFSAEAALKRARLNYSVAVDHLQKDLELLSFQVLSMYETNENLIRQAFSDTALPSYQEFPVKVQNQKPNSEANTLFVGVKKPHSGGDILLEDLKKSLHLQEGLYRKVEEETCEMHFVNLYLDVFSKTLQGTLLEAKAEMVRMKERIYDLTQHLGLETESKELLTQRLQTAMDDIHFLNEFKATCTAKCNEMALQNEILEANLQDVTCENDLLKKKITEWESVVTEFQIFERKYEAVAVEKCELADLFEKQSVENGNLRHDISSLKEELKTIKTEFDELASKNDKAQNSVNFLENRMRNMLSSYGENFCGLSVHCVDDSVGHNLWSKDLEGLVLQLEELQHNAGEKIRELLKDKNSLLDEKENAQLSLSKAESDLVLMKEKFKSDVTNLVRKLDVSNALVQNLQLKVETAADKLQVTSEIEENHIQRQRELLSDLDHIEAELHQIGSENRGVSQIILALESAAEELERSKQKVAELISENQVLMLSLQNKSEEGAKLESEIKTSKQSLQSLTDNLLVEKSLRNKLENNVTELSLELNEKQSQLVDFDQQKFEVFQLKQVVSDLELEKSRVCSLLLHCQDQLKTASEESSSVFRLEWQLVQNLENLIATDVRLVFSTTQYEALVEELQKKILDLETVLNSCLARGAECNEENARLLTSLETLRSELHSSNAENRALQENNSILTTQLEEYKDSAESLAISNCDDKNQLAAEVERLKHFLESSDKEIDDMIISREELEVKVLLLKALLHEQLEEYNDELMMLRSRCNELNRKLAEQNLKAEEFKNLSIHLKELKDKADAECSQLRGKRESEGPATAIQESLRIAFIKEQYETKVQELRHQLTVSKKHSEEMLWKLQDAIDELENRKKSEASHLKRNEELGVKILELEAELQSLISEKREKVNAYDMLKAELECSLMTLECCKEEKQKVEASLLECSEEKSKLSADLLAMKELLNSSNEPVVGNLLDEHPVVGSSSLRVSDDIISSNGSTRDVDPKSLNQDCAENCEDLPETCLVPTGGGSCSSALVTVQLKQDVPGASVVNGIPSVALVNQGTQQGDTRNLALIRAQSLKSSMDHLNEELERMKNENSLASQGEHHYVSKFPGLQRELMQLHKVNEELESIYPQFLGGLGSGNALERVLALEIELAGALQAKKKSSIHFQSSFLKQHSDEEAIFQSFRDINELIKDMLEIKGKYTAVETELKEMHDRYSQLSLQFAEVEGERQKLMMTLKNVRSSRRSQSLFRTTSASLGDSMSQ